MKAHSRYAQEFNRRYKRCGHLWHSRFFSCALDADHLHAALLYVDRNPVRAGLVGDATAYRWSSARGHTEGSDEAEMLSWARLAELGGCEDWLDRLSGSESGEDLQGLRRATLSGTPFAGPEFVAELEGRLGRPLRLRSAGRPRKTAAASAAAA